MKQPLLTQQQLASRLDSLNSKTDSSWEIVSGKLHKQFVLRNFIQAMGFMTQAAIIAEKMNHHPEWSNVYKSVEVNLTTHSSSGITALDFELATEMEKILS